MLKSTAQLRGPTIYELVQYHSPSDIEIEESNIPSEGIQYPATSDPISLPEGCNIPSEYPLKEHKRNGKEEQEKDNHSAIRELREYLENCLDEDRPEAIRAIMDYVDDGPDWWTKRPEEAISHYLDHQDELIDEVLARSDTKELEVDHAGRGRLRWG